MRRCVRKIIATLPLLISDNTVMKDNNVLTAILLLTVILRLFFVCGSNFTVGWIDFAN